VGDLSIHKTSAPGCQTLVSLILASGVRAD
jgi:hypothetical protein